MKSTEIICNFKKLSCLKIIQTISDIWSMCYFLLLTKAHYENSVNNSLSKETE